MRKIQWLVFLFILAVAQTASAFFPVQLHQNYVVWYADSVNGNDSNNCKNAASACASIHALFDNALCTGPQAPYGCCNAASTGTCTGTGKTHMTGERIYLASGSSWNEQLNLPAAGVKVIGYGTGAQPRFDASVTIPTSAWSLTTGTTYQASLTHSITGTVSWVLFYDNNTNLIKETALATCESTPGSYYVTSDTAASFTLYVNTSDGTNPATNGRTYAYSYWPYGIYSVYNQVEIQNVFARRAWGVGESISVHRLSMLYNVWAEDGSRHNIYYQDGCALVNCTCHNAYYAGGGADMFVLDDASPPGYGVLHLGCYAYSDSISGLVGNNGAGIAFQEECSPGSYGLIQYINSSISNLTTAFNGTSPVSVPIVINNTTWSNVINGSALGVNQNITGGTFSSNSTSPGQFAGMTLGYTTNVTGVIITMNHIPNTGIFTSTTGGTLNFTNSKIYYNSSTANYMFYMTGSGAGAITSTGNTFSTTNGGHGYDLYYITDTNASLTSNNNCFYSFGNFDNNFHGTALNSQSAWQGANFDLNSTWSSSCN
jgi:hypothetical protein